MAFTNVRKTKRHTTSTSISTHMMMNNNTTTLVVDSIAICSFNYLVITITSRNMNKRTEHKDFHYIMWRKPGLMVVSMVANILRTSQIIIIIAPHTCGLAFTMSIIVTNFGGDMLLSWTCRHKFCTFFWTQGRMEDDENKDIVGFYHFVEKLIFLLGSTLAGVSDED